MIGAMEIALGRPKGLGRFGDTEQAYLASLAPMVALALVAAGLGMVSGVGMVAVTSFFLMLVAQLAPAVLSHALAVRWGREGQWLRFATAFNWCQWVLPVFLFLLLVLVQGAVEAGVPQAGTGRFVVGALAVYALWLHWTLARHGLELSRIRAGVLVLLVNFGTGLLVVGPQLLQGWAEGPPA